MPTEGCAAGDAAATVFVCRDPVLDELLDALCERLRALGVRVLRGPSPQPGVVLDYAPARFGELFAEADVAMFSSRSRCPRALLAAAPRLRAVVNPTIGLETVDVAAATEMGIVVGHGATMENVTGMAEASVMLMLNLMYALRRSEAVLAENLPRPPLSAARARLVQGATIGLVGLGRIGSAVLHRLLPFGARLLVHSPHAHEKALPEGVRAVGLDELLAQSHIVGLFVAVTPHNRRMIDARALSLMRSDAFLVNVARGDAIDEPALIDALRERRIAGAALDTFAVEPLPPDSPLRTLDNVILTPHLVGHTREGNQSLAHAAYENVTRVLRGESPLHCKNPDVLARWQQRLRGLPSIDLPG